MKLHVLLYRDADNPRQYPELWPAQVREIHEIHEDDAPVPDAPWLEMSLAEYADYRAQHQSEYDAWETGQTEPDAAPTLDISQISVLWQQLPIDVQAQFAPYRAPFATELEAGNYAVARRMIELQISKLPASAAGIADAILAKIPAHSV